MEALLEDIILSGESKVLEFKESLPSSDKIAKTVIAFSNTSGGKLIIGVNDKRKIKGVDPNIDIFELQDKIASIIYELCYPNILPEFYTTNVDGKLLFVIEVYRGNLLPYYLKREGRHQGTYIRIGSTTRRADVDTIVDLERQRTNKSFDEEVCFDVALKDLDLTPLQKRFNAKGKELNVEKLKNLRLVSDEHGHLYPTQALLILLGLRENATVKCARFKGTTVEVFTDKKEFGGDVFSQLDNVEIFIKNHLNLEGVIRGLQREDRYEIPVEAIREVIVNAYVHRDYINLGRDIKVGIYDDIVNIVSPGGFPTSITIEDILAGRSEARNKVLAKVFKELDYIEQWGSGIKRVFAWCTEAGIRRPLIAEKGDFVDVEFYRSDNSVQENTIYTSKSVRESNRNIQEYIMNARKKAMGCVMDTGKNVRDDVRDDVRDCVRDSVVDSARDDNLVYLNSKQKHVLQFCLTPHGSQEILNSLKLSYHSRNIKLYITELVKDGLLNRVNPDTPYDKNQKYVTTSKGMSYI